MKLKNLLRDFNLLATTSRGNEKQLCSELSYLLKEGICDPAPTVERTGIRGLVVAKTSFDPFFAIDKFRNILLERPYEFRYALRIIPIERVVFTNLDEIKHMAAELSAKIGVDETFRVTVEKRFTSFHSQDLIESVASALKNKVDLKNPSKILLIEVIGKLTGISIIKGNDILAVVKEKLL